MAKICSDNVVLVGYEKIILGDNAEHEIYWDSTASKHVGIVSGPNLSENNQIAVFSEDSGTIIKNTTAKISSNGQLILSAFGTVDASDSTNCMTAALIVQAPSGYSGICMRAGEQDGDYAIKIYDQDETFEIFYIDSQNGIVGIGTHSPSYGVDIRHDSGNEQDFNTQTGNYRIGGIIVPIQRYVFNMQDVIYPTNAEWQVNVGAPLAVDSNNGSLFVRRFDDTNDEAIGLYFNVPSNANDMNIILIHRAETAPGATATVDVDYFVRPIPNNSAVGSWISEPNDTISVPANENWQYTTYNTSLTDFSITAGLMHQMQIVRDANGGSDNLSGDWTLLQVILEFY